MLGKLVAEQLNRAEAKILADKDVKMMMMMMKRKQL